MNLHPSHRLPRLLQWAFRASLQCVTPRGMPSLILVFTLGQFLTYATLYRVPQYIDLDSPTQNAQTSGESPKADKPPSPDVEKVVPKSSEPLSSSGTRSSPCPDMAMTSPIKATPNLDPPCDSPNLATAEFPNVSPPSPPSRGLGSASGFPPRQYS
jgi:hypothetical protein